MTAGNAASVLFAGTDADGGIDDWYVSNGVVQAIVDDVGPQDDLVPLLGPAAPPKVSEFALSGCSVLDLGNNGQNNDHLTQIFTVGGLSTSNFIVYSGVSASSTPTSATITCTGNLLGFDQGATPVPPSDLVVVTEYTAANADPYLTVTTTVTNNHPTNPASGLGGFLDVSLWTQRAQVPFSPVAGKGFKHAVLDFSNIAAALELPPFAAAPGLAGPGDGIIDPANNLVAGENAYGILGDEASIDQDGAGPNPPVVAAVNSLFGVSSNLLTAFGNSPLGTLQPGGVLTYKRRIYVGSKNDVAAVANPMITEIAARRGFATGTISGEVDAADATDVAASVIATRTGGAALPVFGPGTPVTQFRTSATGAFSGIVLPVGTYSLEVRSPERDPVTVTGVVVNAAANTAVTVPELSALATLDLKVLETVAGPDPAMPAKITIKGVAPTVDPRFKSDVIAIGDPTVGPDVDLRMETFGGGPAQANWVFLASGSGTVQLRPGKYEIYASRGPEYSLRRKIVNVRAQRTRKINFRLRRSVDTAGFVSGDFHIHSARSLDSTAPLQDRVAGFAAEGVEVMVSTDHDYQVDYAPIIANLNLGSRITSMVGNEVTGSVPNPPAFPDSTGHINAWPLTVQANARRDGAIEDEFVAPNWIFKRLRDQGAQVLQYNHVRAGVSGITSIGFFNNFGYDPSLPLAASPNDMLLDDDVTGPGTSGVSNPDGLRNIDFDVMEILNGTEIPAYIAVRRDWLSLLNQIDPPTVPFIGGTGTSDSHRVTLESAGYARTYVGGAGDDPATLDPTTFNANVKAANMMATTGPFIRFSVLDTIGASAGLGGTLVPASGTVRLRIEVQAANWIPVDQVRVIANGFTTLTFDATTSPKVGAPPASPFSQALGKITRFDAEIPVNLAVDTYFIVEAGAKLSPLPTPDALIDKIVPGMIPLGFTNPIFVDLAGDGFDSPGLPVMATATLLHDELPAFARLERADQTWLASLRGWLSSTLAALTLPREASAHGSDNVLADGTVVTGKELAEKVQRDKNTSTGDYFPLYRFSIPADAADAALRQQLPPEEVKQLEADRAKAAGAAH
ncbi:CehA/McbA family metallohydrolase [Candidatus Binatia bacterium]|nr:CehA/McbA family metallohydrolase [Candidatus Binatia bacterium]